MKAPVKIKKKKAPNKYPWPLNQKKVEKAITQLYRDFDSYRRLGGFMDMLECGELTPPEAMIVLGETWTTFDNLRNFPQLQEYLEAILEQSSDALRLMMTAKELKTHDKLPETLTVYRGCYNTNDDGISYSLDRDVATSFPGLNRYRMARKRPMLVTAKVLKKNAVLKLDRHEQEIIAVKRRIIKTTPLTKAQIAQAIEKLRGPKVSPKAEVSLGHVNIFVNQRHEKNWMKLLKGIGSALSGSKKVRWIPGVPTLKVYELKRDQYGNPDFRIELPKSYVNVTKGTDPKKYLIRFSRDSKEVAERLVVAIKKSFKINMEGKEMNEKEKEKNHIEVYFCGSE